MSSLSKSSRLVSLATGVGLVLAGLGVTGSASATPAAAGLWTMPIVSTTLSVPSTDATSVQTALSADGSKATAVWERKNGTYYVVQSASATISAGVASWGAVQDLSAARSASADGDTAMPQVALSADGSKATAIWVRNNGTYTVVQSVSARIAGSVATWGAALDISAPRATTDGAVAIAQVALSADGSKATTIWCRSNGLHRVTQSRSATISAGVATWGAVSDLSMLRTSTSDGDTYNRQVALSADGSKAVAVWVRSNGLYGVVQSATATISGAVATWSAAQDLSPARVATLDGDASAPQVGISADGSKVSAVWVRFNAIWTVVQSASASVAAGVATWGAVKDLSAPRATTDGNASGPQIGLSADGSKATATWMRINASFGVIGQSASATISARVQSWGATTDVATVADWSFSGANGTPMALSADGTKVTAVWQIDSPNEGVQVSTGTVRGNVAIWTAPTPLATTAIGIYNGEAVALSANGAHALAIWVVYDGTNFTVQAAPSWLAIGGVVIAPGANFTGMDLSGMDLAGVDLTGVNLSGANLTGANLTGAIWHNTICPDRTNSATHIQGSCLLGKLATGSHVISARVYFAQNVYALNAADIATLRALLAKLPAKAKVTSVKVVGYVQGTTNTQGTAWCSLQRARAAAAYLHLRHLGGVFHVSGAGAVGPSSNNRRATITITYTS